MRVHVFYAEPESPEADRIIRQELIVFGQTLDRLTKGKAKLAYTVIDVNENEVPSWLRQILKN